MSGFLGCPIVIVYYMICDDRKSGDSDSSSSGLSIFDADDDDDYIRRDNIARRAYKKRALYGRRGKYNSLKLAKRCVRLFKIGAKKGTRCTHVYFTAKSEMCTECSNQMSRKRTPRETKVLICERCDDLRPAKRFLRNDPICIRCHNKHRISSRVTKIVKAKVWPRVYHGNKYRVFCILCLYQEITAIINDMCHIISKHDGGTCAYISIILMLYAKSKKSCVQGTWSQRATHVTFQWGHKQCFMNN